MALLGSQVYVGELMELLRVRPGSFRARDYVALIEPWVSAGYGDLYDSSACWRPEALHQVLSSMPEEDLRKARVSRWDPEHAARLALYGNDESKVATLEAALIRDIVLPDLHWDWLCSRRPRIQAHILQAILPSMYCSTGVPKPIQDLLATLGREARCEQLELALMQGDFGRAEALLLQYPELVKAGYRGALLFLQGQPREAHQGYLRLLGKSKAKTPAFAGMAGLFGRLAAMHSHDLTAMVSPRYHAPEYVHESRILELMARARVQTEDQNLQATLQELLRRWSYRSRLGGLSLALLAALQSHLSVRLRHPDEASQTLAEQGLKVLAEQISPPPGGFCWGPPEASGEAWRQWLEGFRQGAQHLSEVRSKGPARAQRLIWLLSLEGNLQALRQNAKESGPSGSEVALTTLVKNPPDYLSEQDRVVVGKFRSGVHGRSITASYDARALQALVGHPHLFVEGERRALREASQTLELALTDEGYRLRLKPDLQESEFALELAEDGAVNLYLSRPHSDKIRALLYSQPVIPPEAREELRQALLPWLDKISLSYAENTPPLAVTVSQSMTLLGLLQPDRQGLRLGWGLQPLGPEGPTIAALRGSETESLRWNGQLYQIQRNLAEERRQLEDYRRRCAALAEIGPSADGVVSDREEALELLRQLREADIPLHWPQGKSWKLSPRLDTQQLRLQAQRDHEWFSLQGQLEVQEGLVVELGRMLALLREFPGRYVPLDEQQFLHVSDELRHQLQGLDELAEVQRKSLRISPLAVPTLQELGFAQLEADQDFRDTLARFEEASNYRAKVPKAIQADLREYQVEGFRWLAQRAQAQVGACLADDMGLGKTLQVICLMVAEQSSGPHLVVCPTSVTSNWKEQLERFAPTLQPALYEGKDRATLLRRTKAGQVVICSYRLLLQDLELLENQVWNVTVLDEAQAIKNPEAKTSRACFSLKSRLRVATSGTPIENRLSELWSLFHFLNPGLLGSLASFRKRFETCSNDGSSHSRRRLRRLVSPFLLRRVKSQVLSELPPRTELVLEVDLSSQERGLYESLRRQAEESLDSETGRFELLAHLTRLRQACCHPALITPQLGLSSSKLEAFLELAEDLRKGNHRALVFSQFTRLLDLVEEQLKNRRIEYFRLDGSTAVGERRRQVEAFQAGQRDLFLISLKAGGTGLNLTGADYVVHLDPWWNPAAEDQASDRTHRIGQTRPVTIYRLIARNTIEEKVIHLHGQKRQLAETILSGGEASTLSQAELLDLLRDETSSA